jgi:hypothetical protein
VSERLNHLSLVWAYVALIATGAVLGGLYAAIACLIDWARGRRT